MTTMSPKKDHDPTRVNEISEMLMDNPELAKLIGELSMSDAGFWYRCSGDPVLPCSG